MRICLVVLLLAGCASNAKIPEGGWTTKNGAAPQSGEMLTDWKECSPPAMFVLWGSLGDELHRSSAVDCMTKKGWK